MGFLKDYSSIKKETRKIRDNSPGAGVRMREASEKMAAASAAMAQTAALTIPDAGSVPAQIQVVSVTPTAGSVNGQPLVDVTVTVLAPGLPPVPASAKVMVPATSLHRLHAGATLPARIDPNDPAAFAIDWASPG